ncbi:hypothetical protein [Leptothoe sp. PORK10 BA2]|uniref:hypothetical protein n=1 Tax=Leptothoe sp. PORK10 BA2 TaxID=3110254 RepID=UPI002B21BBAC|nr:hypothetical protein [Leptothoe sp. PORK10 BA2]MEA5463700.1 hypothetical protein [Leptothoe sp. PORK10 BA2]
MQPLRVMYLAGLLEQMRQITPDCVRLLLLILKRSGSVMGMIVIGFALAILFAHAVGSVPLPAPLAPKNIYRP